MTLFSIWAITFLCLGVIYCLEGWADPDHWEEETLKETIFIAALPLVAQLVLVSALWSYGSYYLKLALWKVRKQRR